MVGVFPNDASVCRLTAAVVLETHDEWAVADRRYLSELSMAELRKLDADHPAVEVVSQETPHALAG